MFFRSLKTGDGGLFDGDSSFFQREDSGFDFNSKMELLIAELVSKIDGFQHFDAKRIRVSASFSRTRSRSGLLAYVVPLKFKGGVPIELRKRGDKVYHWALMPKFLEGVEVLYYIYFLLPRFLNLPFRDKLETVVHELYHLHPDFNGDLRRFKGRSRTHGCMKSFEKRVRELTDEYLFRTPAEETRIFLKRTGRDLKRRFGEIQAVHHLEPRPKLLKVTESSFLAQPLLT